MSDMHKWLDIINQVEKNMLNESASKDVCEDESCACNCMEYDCKKCFPDAEDANPGEFINDEGNLSPMSVAADIMEEPYVADEVANAEDEDIPDINKEIGDQKYKQDIEDVSELIAQIEYAQNTGLSLAPVEYPVDKLYQMDADRIKRIHAKVMGESVVGAAEDVDHVQNILDDFGVSKISDIDALEAQGKLEAFISALMPYYEEDMPYGVITGDEGLPDEYIIDELISKGLITEQGLAKEDGADIVDDDYVEDIPDIDKVIGDQKYKQDIEDVSELIAQIEYAQENGTSKSPVKYPIDKLYQMNADRIKRIHAKVMGESYKEESYKEESYKEESDEQIKDRKTAYQLYSKTSGDDYAIEIVAKKMGKPVSYVRKLIDEEKEEMQRNTYLEYMKNLACK